MSAPADIVSASPPTTAPRQRKPMRMTPAKLRAQRANARLSSGPRTQAGRRRSAQNSRRFQISRMAREDLEQRGADLAEVKRLWQDVMAVFWFMDPDCRFYLEMAALKWWHKLDGLRTGSSRDYVKGLQGDIEKYLRQAVERFAKRRQRSERWLCKELGVDFREGMGCVRVAVESRLGTLQRALGLGPPGGMTVLRTNPKPHVID